MKYVLVTGACSGMGQATVRAPCNAGYGVVAPYRAFPADTSAGNCCGCTDCCRSGHSFGQYGRYCVSPNKNEDSHFSYPHFLFFSIHFRGFPGLRVCFRFPRFFLCSIPTTIPADNATTAADTEIRIAVVCVDNFPSMNTNDAPFGMVNTM